MSPDPKENQCVVLFAEDDPAVRRMVHTLLLHDGYHVLTAEDGQEALEVARRHSGPIHVLLTDVKMPRLNGLELVEHFTLERPETKVLVMSGRLSSELHAQKVRWKFLRKPFLPAALRDQLIQLLDESDAMPCTTVQ